MPKLRLRHNLRGTDGEANLGAPAHENLEDIESAAHRLDWENVVDGALSVEHLTPLPDTPAPLTGALLKRAKGSTKPGFSSTFDDASVAQYSMNYPATMSGNWVSVAIVSAGPFDVSGPFGIPNHGQARVFLVGQCHAEGEVDNPIWPDNPLERHFLRLRYNTATGVHVTTPRAIGTYSAAYSGGLIHSFAPTEQFVTVYLEFMARYGGSQLVPEELTQDLVIYDASLVSFEVYR